MDERPGGIRFSLNNLELKLIAMVTMLIDHIAAGGLLTAAGLSPLYSAFRLVGRLAFPLFAFLLAEGARRTRDIRRYILRLGIFALLSEIPFDLLFNWEVSDFSAQNIYFTLTAGLVAIWAFREANTRWAGSRLSLLGAVTVILMMVLAELLKTDYGAVGVLFIFGMYIWLCEGRPFLHGAFIMLVFGSMWYDSLQLAALLAFLPMFLYNGQKGTSLNKFWFYSFYPLHLLALAAIRFLLVLNMMPSVRF